MNTKPFYERSRDDKPYAILDKNRSVMYPPHYHGVLEIFVVKKGNFSCSINGKIYNVPDNSIAIIDHYDLHYYLNEATDGDVRYVMTIPHTYLTTFNKLRENKRILNNVITDKELCDKVINLMDVYVDNNSTAYELQSAIDLIFSQILTKLCLADDGRATDFELIKNILIYIEQNFKDDVSRSTIAKALGYTETHVSRVFHQYIGYTIPHYVNILRLEYVNANRDKRKNLISIIMESGFKSIQSYYRNKNLIREEKK